MSVKANYYKLGLFVLGAMVCAVLLLLIVGSGRWFTQKLTVETYFNESVQGLDIGSRLKYRGVEIGSVTRITFTYTRYQLDRPMVDRARYVLVEAEIQPRLLGGRAAAGDLTQPDNAALEVERGLRVRLAPQGITGTSYLEIDYVDPATNPVLVIDWTPLHIYIPSARSTVTTFVDAASEILNRLHNLDVEGTVANLNKLLVTATARVEAVDAKGLSDRADRALSKVEQALAGVDGRKLSGEANALLAELRESNAELKKTLSNPALQRLPQTADAAIADVGAAAARMRELVSDPKLAQSIARMERSLSRIDRVLGGTEQDLTTTIANLRQITDNLRDLTEDAKRYPSNVLFGGPPQPLPRRTP